MGESALASLAAYSRLVAECVNRPSVSHSTLAVWSDSPFTGIAEGEVHFKNGVRLRMREELDFDAGLIGIIFYLAVIAVSLTTWLQTVVQRVMPAFQTAVIYSLEPVFAAIFSWWLIGERLNPQGFICAALILLAMIVSQIPENGSVTPASNSSSD